MRVESKKQRVGFVVFLFILVSVICTDALAQRGVTASSGPSPKHRGFDVDPYPTLSWKSGAAADRHDLYLGTDEKLVTKRDSKVHIGLLKTNRYKPEMLTLATTYYWAVDEVSSKRPSRRVKGDVWKFVVRNSTEGYVADILFDGGTGVAATKPEKVPAVKMTGFTVENLYDSKETQNVFVRVDKDGVKDDNGLILYPDREPRYRFMMVFGGTTRSHVRAVTPEGCKNVHDFWANGGGYTGNCAGAWCAQRKNFNTCPLRYHGAVVGGGRVSAILPDGKTPLKYWETPDPEDKSTWVQKTWKILPRSPVADYYPKAFSDYKVFGLREAGGPKVEPWRLWNEHCEALFLFDMTRCIDGPNTKKYFAAMKNPWDYSDPLNLDYNRLKVANSRQIKSQNSCAIWAYKTSDTGGRSVPCSPHPETDLHMGETKYVQAAIFKYVHAGFGRHTAKASLTSGDVRKMNNNSKPGYEKIGDKQYHHFTIKVPKNTATLKVELDGAKYDMNLYAKRGDFAFKGERDVISARNKRGNDEKLVIERPKPGVWFIGVKCNTGIETNAKYPKLFKNYKGRLDLLNGIAYSIKATVNK
ncbi:MAG: hypothetical protein HN350_20780 [Phycisphaerales bacterium]|jgi:hypothetical protein|nr:hypothetical protein [Phycisphaerales bacterium]